MMTFSNNSQTLLKFSFPTSLHLLSIFLINTIHYLYVLVTSTIQCVTLTLPV